MKGFVGLFPCTFFLPFIHFSVNRVSVNASVAESFFPPHGRDRSAEYVENFTDFFFAKMCNDTPYVTKCTRYRLGSDEPCFQHRIASLLWKWRRRSQARKLSSSTQFLGLALDSGRLSNTTTVFLWQPSLNHVFLTNKSKQQKQIIIPPSRYI